VKRTRIKPGARLMKILSTCSLTGALAPGGPDVEVSKSAPLLSVASDDVCRHASAYARARFMEPPGSVGQFKIFCEERIVQGGLPRLG
jgi:hypothetical protein